jgi:protein phosphatase
VDIAHESCQEGDLYLFCSDGLSNMLTDEEIVGILETESMELMSKADRLIEAACANGGIDNISVILARVSNANRP